MFSQGVPFFHAGDDILRSKSFDPNSYNSGDWYNRLDWTYESDNFGVGLPLEGTAQWEIYKPLLADPKLAPAKADIESASAVFREFLQIRSSAKLFRFETGKQIKDNVSFYNTGPEQVPGLIVMRLTDKDNIDPLYEEIVVLFNARPEFHYVQQPGICGQKLHPAFRAAGIQRCIGALLHIRPGQRNVYRGRPDNGRLQYPARAAHPSAGRYCNTGDAFCTPENNMPLTIVAVVGGLIAVIAFMFALRRKDNRR